MKDQNHRLNYQDLPTNKKSSLISRLIAINFALLGIFLMSQFFATTQVGTKSQEIDYIREEKDRLREENEFLKSDIQKEKAIITAQPLIEKYGLEKKNIIQIPKDPNQSLAFER